MKKNLLLNISKDVSFSLRKIINFFSACQKNNILPWVLGFTLALTIETEGLYLNEWLRLPSERKPCYRELTQNLSGKLGAGNCAGGGGPHLHCTLLPCCYSYLKVHSHVVLMTLVLRPLTPS